MTRSTLRHFLVGALAAAALGLHPAAPQQTATQARDARAGVTRHLDMNTTMPVYATREAWLERRRALRGQILNAAGLQPLPEKTPLRPQIFGRLERRGTSVEKVYFESLPGFYVTGNLYRPLERQGPLPAVLSPHGHWAYGRLQNDTLASVPLRAVNLARQGYVVFTYDMIGYNDSRQVTHRFEGKREALWGFGSLGLQLWNSIRAVDFLESLPEVDRSRIACTGASGGGTQTFLLAAVDDRIAVSAPVNMISAHMQGGCVCENAPGLRIDANNMEIGAMMAPRPMIMVSATGDWTRNTLDVEFPAVRSIYRLFGAEDRLTVARIDAPHNYNRDSRQHVYRWFGRWLLGKTDPAFFAETSDGVEFPPDLLVFYGRTLPEGAKTERQIADGFIAAAAAALDALRPRDASGLARYRDAFEPALRCTLMADAPNPSAVRATVSTAAQASASGHLTLGREGADDSVPATLWRPRTAPRRAVLLLHPEGAAAAASSLVTRLVAGGAIVLSPDLFNTGDARVGTRETKRYTTCYNRTDDANRVQDILTSLAYLEKEKVPIRVAALGRSGLWAMLARGLVRGDASWWVDAAGFDASSDDAYLRELDIPGIRRAGDFKTAALVGRGALRIQGAAAGFPSEWIREAWRNAGLGGALEIGSESASEEALALWLGRD